MDCRITSSKGFTLTEVMVATAIASTVMLVIGTMMIQLVHSMQALDNYSTFERESQQALDKLSRDIRQAQCVAAATANTLSLSNTNGLITYTYNAAAATLTRAEGDGSSIVLRRCIQLTFDLRQRSPTVATYDVFPTSEAKLAKLVQISWRCGITNADGTLSTTDSQSARVVIRKQ